MGKPPTFLPDERVLWKDAPPTGLRFYPHDATYVPFALFWTGFTVFWNVNVWRQGHDWIVRLWGVPFLAAGAYMLIGRHIVDAWARGRLHYYVTNRRVIVMRSGWRGRVDSVSMERLPPMQMTERADGSGDLRFGPRRFRRGKGGRQVERDLAAPALDPTPQFISIADVAAVFNLIERAAKRTETLRLGGRRLWRASIFRPAPAPRRQPSPPRFASRHRR